MLSDPDFGIAPATGPLGHQSPRNFMMKLKQEIRCERLRSESTRGNQTLHAKDLLCEERGQLGIA